MGYIELNVLNAPNSVPDTLAFGIDLGTTNSLAAIFRDGRPVVLHPEGRGGLVPSVVYFPPDGMPIVGREARDHAVADPRNVIFSIKRFMGRGLKDVQPELRSLPYRASETANLAAGESLCELLVPVMGESLKVAKWQSGTEAYRNVCEPSKRSPPEVLASEGFGMGMP